MLANARRMTDLVSGVELVDDMANTSEAKKTSTRSLEVAYSASQEVNAKKRKAQRASNENIGDAKAKPSKDEQPITDCRSRQLEKASTAGEKLLQALKGHIDELDNVDSERWAKLALEYVKVSAKVAVAKVASCHGLMGGLIEAKKWRCEVGSRRMEAGQHRGQGGPEED